MKQTLVSYLAVLFAVMVCWQVSAQLPMMEAGPATLGGPPPAYQGLGDIITSGVVVYHAPGSCYTSAYTGNIAIVKDLTLGTTSTTLGCNAGGLVVVKSGSAIASTCGSTCIWDTAYDQSGANNCASAPCNLTQTFTGFRNNNPFFGLFAPNGAVYAVHLQGYAAGTQTNGIAVSGNNYDPTTGLVTLTTTAPHFYNPGGAIRLFNLGGSGTNLASLNGRWPVVAPTSGTTITVQATAGLGPISITGGSYTPTPQTINNNTGGAFGNVGEPYTVVSAFAETAYGGAGFSGGPNGCNGQGDCVLNVGANTNTTPPAATLEMYNGHNTTATFTGTLGTFYSVMAVFDDLHSNSKLCVNGVCVPKTMGGSVTWGSSVPTESNPLNGYSWGNGTGGLDYTGLEAALYSGDKSSLAPAVYANEQSRLGIP